MPLPFLVPAPGNTRNVVGASFARPPDQETVGQRATTGRPYGVCILFSPA